MPLLAVVINIVAQILKTVKELVPCKYLAQCYLAADVLELCKLASKIFWSSVATRTKKSDALVRQSQHSVRYWLHHMDCLEFTDFMMISGSRWLEILILFSTVDQPTPTFTRQNTERSLRGNW
eukprot:1546025-Amphidinium_carterae.1